MQIRRAYTRANINQLFFPVEERDIQYYDGPTGSTYQIPRHKALIDAETGAVLSVVSRRYKVLKNEDAFGIVRPIADSFFGGHGLSDFECFNIFAPKSRASCRIDLTRPSSCSFKLRNGDKYIAFIRIANSYNHTYRFSIVLGFCRWICMNGCIFGEKSHTFSVDHNDKRLKDVAYLRRVAEEALKDIGDLAFAQKEFSDMMTALEDVSMSKEQMRRLFCAVNNVFLTEQGVADLVDAERERLVAVNGRMDELINSYTEEFGNTAYAAYNVLTDFASYPDANKKHSVLSPSKQGGVGDWFRNYSSSMAASDGGLFGNGGMEGYLEQYGETSCLLAKLKNMRSARNDTLQ